ncbi:MAG: ABC transporter permease subunit [Acidimicrobiia bacterium]|nr:ABC transporter permease subunit [Acidimicrobiia bacterium]
MVLRGAALPGGGRALDGGAARRGCPRRLHPRARCARPRPRPPPAGPVRGANRPSGGERGTPSAANRPSGASRGVDLAKVGAIARANLVRLVRDRSNLVPMLLVPIVFVYLIGTQFGGEDRPDVGVAGTGPVADALVEGLRSSDAVDVAVVEDEAEARRDVGAGKLALGVVVPPDADAVLASGAPLEVVVVTEPDGSSGSLRTLVQGVLAEHALVPSLAAELVGPPGAPADAEVRATVATAAEDVARARVEVRGPAGEELETAGGRFAGGAAQQLVLMVFLFTLVSAVPMVQSRRSGIAERMLATPTSTRTIVTGEAAGRWLVALAQGAWILVVSTVVFDVGWGYLPGAVLVLVAFGAVGAGAGMLLGAVLSDEGTVTGASILGGLTLGALGGCMLPTELFSPTLQTVSKVTPHAWALDAFAVLRDGGGLLDVLAQLGVLAAIAVVLLGLASWRLRVVLSQR